MYWRENGHHYHFGCQFTADLISMNTADFIITSTYQGIAGTKDGVGQFPSRGRIAPLPASDRGSSDRKPIAASARHRPRTHRARQAPRTAKLYIYTATQRIGTAPRDWDMAIDRRAHFSAPYQRRRPERTVLYRAVAENLETHLALCRKDGAAEDPVPAYVECELRQYLRCSFSSMRDR